MKAIVTGASGFIGAELLKRIETPVVLTRDPDRARRALPSRAEVFAWDPNAGPPPAEAFRGVEAVFHLAGEPVARRWNAARKERIRASRVSGTRHLVAGLAGLEERPRVLVSVSAVGYYGDRGDEILDESARPGAGFLAEVCAAWEAESSKARELGLRVVNPRIGIALGSSGGALPKMLPPFRLGIGGRLGSGRQWMSWIHVEDLVGILLLAAGTGSAAGPMNATAPSPVTNAEFTRILASVLRRPAVLPVPAPALKILFGETSGVLLGSQRALPRAAQRAGYDFRHPGLEEALRSILSR